MAYTQQEIDALKKALVSGVKKVKFSDRETEFRDLSEMKEILKDAEDSVANKTRQPYLSQCYSRGYKR
jgi:hypothetical protein